ncbi:MAG: Xaa-Pro peptidase family protein [Desulfobulbaceae bacterium]|nr:Xaa-Pro peptidase family protein [Desulfobulbaceae bacterium]
MTDSISQLQRTLCRRQIDVLLVSQPENRRYLSGFTALDHSISESSGVLLIPKKGRSLLLTDFRYQLQAEEEAGGNCDILIYQRGLLPLLKTILGKMSVANLAFEADYFLHAKYLLLTKLAQSLRIQLTPLDGQIEHLRLMKSDEELALIRRSVALNETVFSRIYQTIKPGQTEIEVALALESAMRLLGAERPSFDTIVAGGPNAALPHAVPSHRPLALGEPIVIDMGLILAGYCSDMTRTIVLGTPDEHTVSLFRLVRQAQCAGLAALRPGVTGREVDAAAREVIKKAGYGACFGHSLGHGVGLAVHEAPSLSCRNRKLLRPGMVVTVEPGVYVKGWGGIRLENMAVLTEQGCEVLNRDTTFLDL